MKKAILLYLLFFSFIANVLAQNEKTKAIKSPKKASKTVVKTDSPPKTKMQPKDVKVKKVEAKKPLLPHVVSPIKLKDSVNDKKLSTQHQEDTNKLTEPLVDSLGTKLEPITKQESSSFSFLTILPYGIIAVLLVLIVYVLSRSMKRIEKLQRELNQANHSGSYQFNNLNEQIKRLENEKKKLIEKEESIRDELRLERKKNQEHASLNTQISNPNIEQEVVFQPLILTKENPVKYARYADQGDGFAVSDLLSEEGNDTIFEITTITPTTATFKVTNNLNAQKYALSNAAYFLGKTCKYDSTPSQNSIIRTDLEGELKLQGEKWLITNPAKISFN